MKQKLGEMMTMKDYGVPLTVRDCSPTYQLCFRGLWNEARYFSNVNNL